MTPLLANQRSAAPLKFSGVKLFLKSVFSTRLVNVALLCGPDDAFVWKQLLT